MPEKQSGISRFYSLYSRHMRADDAMMNGNYLAACEACESLRDELSPNDLAKPGAEGNMCQYLYQTQLLSAVRFGRWAEILRYRSFYVDTLVYAGLLSHFARGMALAHIENPAAADGELALLRLALLDEGLKASSDLLAPVYEPGTIACAILSGTIAAQKKQYQQAITSFEKAVATEDALSKGKLRYWALPARHYLGNIYLQMKEWRKAIEVFNTDLQQNPGNIWSLQGLVIAFTATHNATGIKDIREKMANSYSSGIIERPVF